VDLVILNVRVSSTQFESGYISYYMKYTTVHEDMAPGPSQLYDYRKEFNTLYNHNHKTNPNFVDKLYRETKLSLGRTSAMQWLPRRDQMMSGRHVDGSIVRSRRHSIKHNHSVRSFSISRERRRISRIPKDGVTARKRGNAKHVQMASSLL